MTSPLLAFEGVSKRFGHRTIIRDVNLAVGDEIVALLGPNGAGKTTLIHLAAGLLRPTAGRVLVGGQTAGSREARRRLALVPQEAATYAELTPLEHLGWWASLHRRHLERPDHLALLEEAGLREAAGRPAGQISRGQRQRLALCLAFVQEPEVLLLDEPHTALDAAGMAWLEQRLQARRGATLIVEHDHARARRLADRLVMLDGRTVRDAPVAQEVAA